jgi:uncharacterized protein YehS (DUF1456 family)
MAKMKKVELQELKNEGLEEILINIYSNSDFKIYKNENGYILRTYDELVFEDGGIEDIRNYLKLFTGDE